jgi:hypothetical protein
MRAKIPPNLMADAHEGGSGSHGKGNAESNRQQSHVQGEHDIGQLLETRG